MEYKMSLLLALDHASEARKRVLSLCEAIEKLVEEEEVRNELLDLCYAVHDELSATLKALERTLLPSGTSVAVTFYPFEKKGSEEDEKKGEKRVAEEPSAYNASVPRQAGGLRGTVFYPMDEE